MGDAVARARDFALAAHGGQQYGNRPYAYHLDAVAALLAPFGEEAQVVGYLHDVVEDTAVDLDQIRQWFGERVAGFVALVTDEPGVNRRERKAKTNDKLAAAGVDAALALVVKVADRLANLRESVAGDRSKLSMYRKEHAAFWQATYRPMLCNALWDEMTRLLGVEEGEAKPL